MEAQKPKIESAAAREERVEPTRDRGERGSDVTAEAKAEPHAKKEAAPLASKAEQKPEQKPEAKEARTQRAQKSKNNVRKLRTDRMMSKAELARRAGLSTLTVDRVERGMPCRMDTKRKILEALGLKPSDRVMIFGDSPDDDEDND